MFKLRYNILVGIQVLLTAINAALIMRVFGVGIESDAYMLSGSIVGTLTSLQGLFISQFLFFYNDLKVNDIEDAHKFYNATFLFTIGLGIILFLIYNLCINMIIPIFAAGIDAERYELLKSLLRISSLMILATPAISINQNIFNAEMKFSIPYILWIIPLAATVLTQIYLININSKNIKMLVMAQSVSTFLILIIGSILVAKLLIPFKLNLWHKSIKDFVKNSFTMQIGHSIYGFLQPVIINNFLVMFPKGYVSYYYYAKKIIDVVNSVTIGPSGNILRSKMALEFAKKNVAEIRKLDWNYIKTCSIIFLTLIPVVFFIQEPVLRFISANNLTPNDLHHIKYLYLALTGYIFLGIFFQGAVLVLTAAKKSIHIMSINIIYIISLLIFTKILTPYFGIYTIALAFFLCMIVNMIFYKYHERKILNQLSQGK